MSRGGTCRGLAGAIVRRSTGDSLRHAVRWGDRRGDDGLAGAAGAAAVRPAGREPVWVPVGGWGVGLGLTPRPPLQHLERGSRSELPPGPLLTGVGIYMDGQDGQDGSLCRGGGGQLRTEKPPGVRVSSPLWSPAAAGDGRNMLRLYGLTCTYPSQLAPSLKRRGLDCGLRRNDGSAGEGLGRPQGARLQGGATFTLTPALSQRERGVDSRFRGNDAAVWQRHARLNVGFPLRGNDRWESWSAAGRQLAREG